VKARGERERKKERKKEKEREKRVMFMCISMQSLQFIDVINIHNSALAWFVF
jgi:hypothetical protein